MLSRADLQTVRRQNDVIVKAATRDLTAFWDRLDLSDAESARDALLAFVPRLVTQYGDLAAAVAADMYDDMRRAAGARRAFRAVMAPSASEEIVSQRVRFGVQHLWTSNPEQTLKFLEGAATKYVLEPGRETVRISTQKDPAKPRWVRVAEPDACDYCLQRAGIEITESDSEFYEYHDNCQCDPAPVFN